jgi:hypothetical protein
MGAASNGNNASSRSPHSEDDNNASQLQLLLPPVGGCRLFPATSSDPTTTTGWSSLRSYPDPTSVFSGLCLAIMFGRYLHATGGDWSGAIFGLVLNPHFVLYLASAAGTVHLARRSNKSSNRRSKITATASAANQQQRDLPVYEQWIVAWYWWNSWLFHAVMDVRTRTPNTRTAVACVCVVLSPSSSSFLASLWVADGVG